MRSNRFSTAIGVLLYLTTLASMVYTAYVHLNFAADGIENVTWDDIVGTFPILFLFVAVAALIASLVMMLWDQKLAARIAFGACMAAWAYYVPMLCVMSLAYSPLFPFMSVTGIVDMLLPNLFLYLTIKYARRKTRP